MEHALEHGHGKHHMGMPLPHGKLAMWLFLITEIMFFTALIGTYVILRHGQPTTSNPWPSPHDVHLVEWIGALNTFVLICSSLTVVLAHWSLHVGDVKKAVLYIGITLALGCVFLVVKAVEYKSKFEHHILPGHVYEKLDGPNGTRYLNAVEAKLDEIVKGKTSADPKAVQRSKELLTKMQTFPYLSPQHVNEQVAGSKHVKPIDRPAGSSGDVKGIMEEFPNLHIPYAIPWGNMWASCYFAMTGFHAIHVLGGLVIFAIMLIMAMRGRFGVQHAHLVEYTGLYWHFVDIVWIFLFPLLYLV
jgi:cytochrome c oxidase subunit 3